MRPKPELTLDDIFGLAPELRTTEQHRRLCDALRDERGLDDRGKPYDPDRWYGCCYGWELPGFIGKGYR